ncbi:hypothetical protein PM082_024886 [Marasmius tenuissimus]|nr:hypothetical protein PM082_024886 [Marasmius tenuissimus]
MPELLLSPAPKVAVPRLLATSGIEGQIRGGGAGGGSRGAATRVSQGNDSVEARQQPVPEIFRRVQISWGLTNSEQRKGLSRGLINRIIRLLGSCSPEGLSRKRGGKNREVRDQSIMDAKGKERPRVSDPSSGDLPAGWRCLRAG